MNNWIPIDKGLPEDKRNVLITIFESEWECDGTIYPSELKTHAGYIEKEKDGSHTWVYTSNENGDLMILHGNRLEVDDGDEKWYIEILAWMYFPEPYKEGDNGTN